MDTKFKKLSNNIEFAYNRNKNKLQKRGHKNLRDKKIKAIYIKIHQFRSDYFENSIF